GPFLRVYEPEDVKALSLDPLRRSSHRPEWRSLRTRSFPLQRIAMIREMSRFLRYGSIAIELNPVRQKAQPMRPPDLEATSARCPFLPDCNSGCRHRAVPDRHGTLRWRTPPEPQAASPRSRCATDAGEICARVFQRAEKRFPRRRGDR